MFGFSMGEWVILAVIGLVFIGPKDLPAVAQMIGRLLNELKRASGDLTNVLLEARDQTNQSLQQARDEYNKVLEKASIPNQSLQNNPPLQTPQTTQPVQASELPVTPSAVVSPEKKDV